ncbi:hypothetical protein DV736_g2353, partial [Chaetothyriales sp. CBS 134916]
MLDELPVECLQQIIRYLPSASAIANVAAVNRALYAKISCDNYGMLQYFVQRSFPSIRVVSGSWREAAIALTARSRAWSRRAVVARECYPPDFESTCVGTIARSGQKMGYMPVIDSYETSDGGDGYKERVAWAAGGKIVIRSTTRETIVWQTSIFPRGDEPQNDILELRLLRPHQSVHRDHESIVFRRANGEVGLVTTMPPGTDGRYRRGEFVQGNEAGDCMDVSSARQPVLALCSTQTVRLYDVGDRVGPVEWIERFTLESDRLSASRQRCARFLQNDSLAVAPQYLRGRDSAPIKVYDLNANLATDKRLGATSVLLPSNLPDSGRNWTNTIAPLDKVCGNDGTLFLSGWSDGVVRLHDTRTGKGSEMSYADKVDEGQVLSLQPIGHESFLAGSTQNGCLKMFDMRMPGAKVYSYLAARQQGERAKGSQVRRDINIFLALKLPQRQPGWKPLPVNDPRTDRYHGPVYSLSAPSPSSPSVYAGIEDHVLQLTLSSSDDIKRGLVVDPLHGLEEVDEPGVLDLSCYERPREGFESTDAVLLRKQRALTEMTEEAECGWDERWYSAAGSGRRGQHERRPSCLAMAMAEARALYRSILRELPPRTPIMVPSSIRASIRKHFTSPPPQQADATATKAYQLARRQEAEQFIQYLKAQRMYGALLERYNPGMGMDQEERVRLSARRVGMDLPEEWKEGGGGKER